MGSKVRRASRTRRIVFGVIASMLGPSCSFVDNEEGLEGDASIGEQIQEVHTGIMNSYDPNQRGTFQTSISDPWCPGWTPLADGWQVWTGIVTAGNAACDAYDIAHGCSYPPTGLGSIAYQNSPRYSGSDWGGSHDGRDLNIAFLPTDWTRRYVNTNVSLPGQSVVLDVEVEAQYFWPTVNWWDNRYGSAVFREGATPGQGTTYREAWNLPTPQPGDQIVWNGLHVIDECHGDPAEIHPPQAAAWLRKVSDYDYDITFNVASNSFRPFRDSRLNLPAAWYWFRIPDYTADMTVVYTGDNWLVDPRSSYTSFSGFQGVRNCNDNESITSSTPDATFGGGDPCRAQLGSNRRVNEFFAIYTSRGSMSGVGGYVGLNIASIAGTENAGGHPVLASGTYRVCRPDPATGKCTPRLPTFKQVSQGLPKKLKVNLKNYNSLLWGDFENNDGSLGQKFQQYGYTGGNNQTFNINHVGTDSTGPYFTIQNYNGRCFDTYPGSGNGQPVVQWSCIGDAWQRWRFVPTGGSGGIFGYNIKNVYDGRCLAIGGGSKSWGADAVMWDCAGQADTVWHIAEAP